MKGLVTSCLIFTLSLICNHPITASTRRIPLIPAAPNSQSWCYNVSHPEPCITAINSDPRTELKRTPVGAAIILLDAAKANIGYTTAFIMDRVKSEIDADVLRLLYRCLNAYNAIGPIIDFDLRTPRGRRNATYTLDRIEGDLSYYCEWQMTNYYPPVAEQLYDRVDRFEDYLEAADTILGRVP